MKHQLNLLKVAVLFIFSLVITFSSCKKKEIQGPKGDPGTPGNGGNTNISNSDVFVIGTTQWQPISADSSLWQSTYSTTLITKEAANSGSVKLYYQIGSAWFELPYIDADLYTQYGYSEGTLKLIQSDVHGEKIPRPETGYYRLVILSKSARMAGNHSTNEALSENKNNSSNNH